MSIYVKYKRITYNLMGDLQHTQTWTNLRGQGVCDPDRGNLGAWAAEGFDLSRKVMCCDWPA